MASRSVVTALTTMLTATLVTASLGQGPRVAPTPWQDARIGAVGQPKPGQHIRVEGSASEPLIGTFQRTSDGALLLTNDGGERSMPIADITGLWVRSSAWVTGSLVGGVVLAGGGALAASSYCAALETEDTAQCALLGGLGGALAGALIGAAIGSAIPNWHRRYP